jgi:hypothetical protein
MNNSFSAYIIMGDVNPHLRSGMKDPRGNRKCLYGASGFVRLSEIYKFLCLIVILLNLWQEFELGLFN